MSEKEGFGMRTKSQLVFLGTLIGCELRHRNMEKPTVSYGQAALVNKGEDYFLIKPDCQRVPGNPSTSFSIFAIFDGHNGISAAIFAKANLLNDILSAIPQGCGREEWLQALPRALVAGFVKTDIEFQQKGPSVMCSRNLADWLRVDEIGLFNFKPSVRPVPLEVHIQGYPGKFYCPRMNSMNKPTYAAICTHSPTKPVIFSLLELRRVSDRDRIHIPKGDELDTSRAKVLRWPLGSVEIFLSRHCPLWYGWGGGRLKLLQRLAYINTIVYAFTSLPLVAYCTLPAIYLLTGKFVIATVMAMTRSNICKNGMISLSRGGATIYYASVFLYLWVFSTPVVSLTL